MASRIEIEKSSRGYIVTWPVSSLKRWGHGKALTKSLAAAKSLSKRVRDELVKEGWADVEETWKREGVIERAAKASKKPTASVIITYEKREQSILNTSFEPGTSNADLVIFVLSKMVPTRLLGDVMKISIAKYGKGSKDRGLVQMYFASAPDSFVKRGRPGVFVYFRGGQETVRTVTPRAGAKLGLVVLSTLKLLKPSERAKLDFVRVFVPSRARTGGVDGHDFYFGNDGERGVKPEPKSKRSKGVIATIKSWFG